MAFKRWVKFTVLALAALSAAGVFYVTQVLSFPRRVSQAAHKAAIAPSTHLPFYFWDYGLWVDPNLIKRVEIFIPYEKGPPEKLLPTVIFLDRDSKQVLLELHGKRPRKYTEFTIRPIFSGIGENSTYALLEYASEIMSLQKEANFKGEELSLTRFEHPDGDQTKMIGTPWTQATPGERRFFYWGPEGSVFQVRCRGLSETSTCPFDEALASARFLPQPHATIKERKRWTASRIQELLASISGKDTDAEHLLTFYLVSLLTIDPRDPEAYYHLGRLSKNRDTVLSAARFGRDVGLAPAKLSELQSLTFTAGATDK